MKGDHGIDVVAGKKIARKAVAENHAAVRVTGREKDRNGSAAEIEHVALLQRQQLRPVCLLQARGVRNAVRFAFKRMGMQKIRALIRTHTVAPGAFVGRMDINLFEPDPAADMVRVSMGDQYLYGQVGKRLYHGRHIRDPGAGVDQTGAVCARDQKAVYKIVFRQPKDPVGQRNDVNIRSAWTQGNSFFPYLN